MLEDGSRRDKPSVEWADETAVSRRGFAHALFGVSCAAIAGAGLEHAAAAAGAPGGWPELRLDGAAELRPGTASVFSYPEPGAACLLIRLTDDRYVAYSQKCTHLQCPVHYREADQTLQCPCHVGSFDARSGAVVAGPPPRPLPRVRLEQRGDDWWAVGIDA